MKIELTKESVKTLGNASLKVGKHILIEGTKAVAIKAAAKAINVGIDEGMDGVKGLSLDDYLTSTKKGKTKQPKKKLKLFKGKKEEVVDDLIEDIIDSPETADETVEVTVEEKN